MKILVTGASGFVGQHLVKLLKQQGVCVVGVGRKLITSDADMFFSVPDFADINAWQKSLEGCDALVHLAARVHVMQDKTVNPLAEFRKVNVDATLNLAKNAAQAGVKRFVFISSIKVNGERTEIAKPFTEEAVVNPQDAYAVSKNEAEQCLLQIAQQTGMEVVIIRPPLIYGAGVKANFASMMRAVKYGLPLPLGNIQNKRSFLYVGNLVSLIAKCIEHPKAANQVFLVSDGYDVSTTELLQACAKASGVKARLFSVPLKLIEMTAAILGKRVAVQRLCGNLQVDISKARNLLGWEPPISVEDGLKATVLRFVGDKDLQEINS